MFKNILSLGLVSILLLLCSSCRKSKFANEICSSNCLIISGTIKKDTSNPTPIENLEMRIFSARSTGIGMSRRLLLKTFTDANGDYNFSFDASEYLDEVHRYSFQLEFRNLSYTTLNPYADLDDRLETFYDITIDSLDQTIVRDYIIQKKQ